MTAPRSPALVGALVVALGALVLVALRAPAPDATPRTDAGAAAPDGPGVSVRAASLQRRPTSWLLDARVDIELPPTIRAGLDSGVPLEFVLDVALEEPRALLPDRRVLTANRRYGLVYYELTRHYRVRSFDDGTGRNYRSLPSALAGLGTLRAVPLGRDAGDVALADGPADGAPVAGSDGARGDGADGGAGDVDGGGRALRARLSLKLDGRALPLPLQSPFDASWRLPSAPFAWTHTDGDGATAMPARDRRYGASRDLS